VIEIEYSLAGGQRRSTIIQASVSQQQAQAQVAGYMLQRGQDDSTADNLPPHTVEVSLVLVGDLRSILADAGCMSEWKSLVGSGLASKLALLLGQPVSRFTVNVDVVQPEGAAITIKISPEWTSRHQPNSPATESCGKFCKFVLDSSFRL